MAVVESVRVHLHKKCQQVKCEEDLSSPGPVADKRPAAPEDNPSELVDALDDHTSTTPPQPALAALVNEVQRYTQRSTRSHKGIARGQLIDILRKQGPLADIQKGARLFQVTQHGREDHDGQADPEKDEEAGEVGIFTGRVEVGDARLVLDGREEPPFVLVTDLFADGGGGLD